LISPGPDSLLREVFPTLKKLETVLCNFFQKAEKGTFSGSLYEASATSTPKLGKDITKRKKRKRRGQG
jgi:hypothetical protein